MSDRDLIKMLKAVKDDPRLGALTDGQREFGRVSLLKTIQEQEGRPIDTSRPVYSWKNYAQYYIHNFRSSILQPAIVGVGVLILVVGGSLTSVSASSGSVPGDTLYSVKRAAEKTQLALATSPQKRAKLHIAFAGRRLEEVNSIQDSNFENKNERVKQAVDSFKNEVVGAQSAMEEMTEAPEDAVQIAFALDNTVDDFDLVMEYAKNEEQVAKSVREVHDEIIDAGDAASELLVTKAEADSEGVAARDLQAKFQDQIKDINNSVRMVLGRISVINSVLTEDDRIVLNEDVNLQAIEVIVHGFDGRVHDAMALLAAGGYGSAFNILDDIEAKLSNVEQSLIEIEFDIVSQREELLDNQSTDSTENSKITDVESEPKEEKNIEETNQAATF